MILQHIPIESIDQSIAIEVLKFEFIKIINSLPMFKVESNRIYIRFLKLVSYLGLAVLEIT